MDNQVAPVKAVRKCPSPKGGGSPSGSKSPSIMPLASTEALFFFNLLAHMLCVACSEVHINDPNWRQNMQSKLQVPVVIE